MGQSWTEHSEDIDGIRIKPVAKTGGQSDEERFFEWDVDMGFCWSRTGGRRSYPGCDDLFAHLHSFPVDAICVTLRQTVSGSHWVGLV